MKIENMKVKELIVDTNYLCIISAIDNEPFNTFKIELTIREGTPEAVKKIYEKALKMQGTEVVQEIEEDETYIQQGTRIDENKDIYLETEKYLQSIKFDNDLEIISSTLLRGILGIEFANNKFTALIKLQTKGREHLNDLWYVYRFGRKEALTREIKYDLSINYKDYAERFIKSIF